MIRTPLMNIMVSAVERAAKGLIRDFGEIENLQVSRKGIGDFVSQADRNAEGHLVAALQKARPQFNFITEESGLIDSEQESEGTWIIDPLDGTTNFLHGFPHFCINLALKKENEIVAAITYDPIRDEMFMAERGMGAFLANHRLRVSARKSIDECLIGVGDISTTELEKLYTSNASLRCAGSYALDLAYVAAGRLDAAYLKHAKPWDIAAGILLIREAGGFSTNAKDKQTATPETQDIIAGSPHFHTQLVSFLSA